MAGCYLGLKSICSISSVFRCNLIISVVLLWLEEWLAIDPMGGEAGTSRTLIPMLCLPYPLRRTVQWNKNHKARLPETLLLTTSCLCLLSQGPKGLPYDVFASSWTGAALCAVGTQSWQPHTRARLRTRRAGTLPSKCQWLSHRTPEVGWGWGAVRAEWNIEYGGMFSSQ